MALSQAGEQDILTALNRIAASLEALVSFADRASVKFQLPYPVPGKKK